MRESAHLKNAFYITDLNVKWKAKVASFSWIFLENLFRMFHFLIQQLKHEIRLQEKFISS